MDSFVADFDSNCSRAVFDEKVNQLYSNQKLGHIATLVNASILVAVQWDQVNHGVLFMWFGLIVFVTLGRYALVWHHHRRDKSLERTQLWANMFIAGILVSGSAWGLAGIVLFPELSYTHQMFTAFTIGGMVAGASAVYAALRTAFFAFSLPAMLPVIINVTTFQDDVHLAMLGMMILYLMMMSATSLRNRRVIEDSIRLRYEKQSLLNHLSEAKERTETINHQLQAEVNERRRIEVQLEKHKEQLETEVKSRTADLQDRNDELHFEVNRRAQVEAALRESEERYRLLIENTIVGIIVISDQRVTFANNFVSILSGYTVDEIIGKPFIDFIHPDDRELAISNHMKRLSGEPIAESYPIRILNKKKEMLWMEVSAVRLSYEGRPAILIFLRDVSQQRQLEAQLFQNEKMASIGQLAAGVAHEINNPVGFVNSNLHTLGEYYRDIETLVASYREALTGIEALAPDANNDMILNKIKEVMRREENVDLDFIFEDGPQLIDESREGMARIKKIVSDLKDFAHPGSQDRQAIDINSSIESTLNIVWNELKYNANVVKDFGELPKIEGYPQQLNQVFMNLLVNAAQSMKEKGEITIQTRATNSHVEIKISDTGCGITEEDLKRIYDPFFTTKPVGKGTGLGLNVSFNIVKKHNGAIHATSEVGRGTTFTIALPLKQ